MAWIWEEKNWYNFQYDKKLLKDFESKFIEKNQHIEKISDYILEDNFLNFTVDLLSTEAMKSSEIEGEYLNRDSVRSSIRKHLGLSRSVKKPKLAEEGIAELMIEIYKNYDQALSEAQLFDWHEYLMAARWDLEKVGYYRTHDEPMQIVSGTSQRVRVHYEAPPSSQVPQEMKTFISWFNQSRKTSPSLTRAGIAHAYFECIHPFEDGNGRIGRAISIKALSQSLNMPAMICFSSVIEKDKKFYYRELGKVNHSNQITDWLLYFAEKVLESQKQVEMLINFSIHRAKFYDRFSNRLNDRQEKVIKRLFDAGVDGFEGGLSSKNYVTIARTSASTATRDLADLVDMGVLRREGELKAARYYLNVHSSSRLKFRDNS